MWNKYDLFLLLLVFSLIGGIYGGALLLPRVFAILLFPQLLFIIKQCNNLIYFVAFFAVWWIYGLFSFLWTSDIENAAKELCYYTVHFLYFLEIIAFSQFAKIPLKYISLGWLLGMFVTSLIAIWELTTDAHLSVSINQSDFAYNLGSGNIIIRRHASATFGNYNSFVTYICFAFPFLMYLINSDNSKIRITTFVSIIIIFIIVGYDASRGGMISIIGMLGIYTILSKSKINMVMFIPLLLYIFFVGNSDSFAVLFKRMGDLSDGRIELWGKSLNMFLSSVCIGTGMGSVVKSLSDFSLTGIMITHNFFLEILVQYGFLIFIPVVCFIIIQFRKCFHITDLKSRNVLIPAFIMLPVYTIINSGYLLAPYTFAFFASLYVFVNYESFKCYS